MAGHGRGDGAPVTHPKVRVDRSQRTIGRRIEPQNISLIKEEHFKILSGVRAPLNVVRSHFSALFDGNPSLAARGKEIPSYPAAQSKVPVVDKGRG